MTSNNHNTEFQRFTRTVWGGELDAAELWVGRAGRYVLEDSRGLPSHWALSCEGGMALFLNLPKPEFI